jgi:hypothetical protein
LNLAYRWFCKMDLSDPIPDHSTFSKNRHGRFRDSDVLRHVFEVERWKIWLAAVWQLKIPSLKMNKMGYAAQFLCKIYQIFYQK